MSDENQLVSDLIDNAPGVTELDDDIIHEVENNDRTNDTDSSNSGSDSSTNQNHTGRLKDSAGTVYDPAIHETDEQGNPKRTKLGKFRKRRGRKSGLANPTESTQALGYREAGRLAANSVFMTGQVMFGEEWEPQVDPEIGLNEPENMTAAFASYFEQTGMKDPPPWIMLVIVLGSYAGPRLAMPKTKSRVRRMVEWCGLRLKGWKKTKKED